MAERESAATIREARMEEAAELAELMTREIHWGTMPKLGSRFVTLFHEHLIASDYAVCVVADLDGEIAGYSAGLLDGSRFQREFMLRRGPAAALAIAPRLLSPPLLQIALRLGTYIYRAPTDDPPSELIALAVRGDRGGRGIGKAVARGLLQRMAAAGCDPIKIGTVDVSNEAANRSYQRIGARRVRTEEFRKGVPVNVYYWRPEYDADGEAA